MAELLASIALLVVALAAGAAVAVWARLPSALGFLAVGVAYRWAADRWTPGFIEPGVVDGLAELGILVLLFLIGLELDLKRLRDALRSTAWVMPFDLFVPAAAVALLTTLAGWGFQQALAAGMAAAISSTLFGDRITRAAEVPAGSRRRVLGVLISEDVMAGLLIALLVLLAGGQEAGGILGLAKGLGWFLFLLVLLTAGAQLVVPRLLDRMAARHIHELVLLWTVGMIVLFGYLGFLAGSAELGALVAGVAAAEAGSRYVVRNALNGVRDLSLAVFFFGTGLAVQASSVAAQGLLVTGVAAVFLVSKLVVHATGAAASGLGLRAALYTGVGLGTIGEFSLILATVAEREGLAHPDLRTVLVGAIVLLLLVSSLLVRGVPAMERGYARLPKHLRDVTEWTVSALRRKRVRTPAEEQGRRRAVRLLISNVLLLSALIAVSTAVARRYLDDLAARAPFWGPVLFLGVVLTTALPLLIGAYRSYRDIVRLVVGLLPGEREGAGKTRARLVDAWVAGTAFLMLVFLALRLPQTVPVVLAAGLVAVIAATVAWRQLDRFHDTLESTLTRVLGEDDEAAAMLDRVMQRYPWGVRFAGVPVPPGSPVAGRTVAGSRVAELTGAMVAVVQRRGREIVNPPPEETILEGDTLVLLGDLHQLSRAEALVVAHGEALRLEAESRSAVIEEMVLQADSPWAGKKAGEAGIREDTGCLVLGIMHGEGARPRPFHATAPLEAGDRLILLGTPLQLSRARRLTVGPPAPKIE